MWVLKCRLLIQQVFTLSLIRLLAVLKPFLIATNTGEQTSLPLGNIETHQLVTFADDASLTSGAKPMITESSSWKSFAEESRTHGILDILSRPVLLTDSSSLWSTAKLINQYPTDSVSNSVFTFPTSILNKSANIIRKITNFTYFKADVKIRIMVNAQAFSQGKLWIYFSPYELGSGTQTSADNMAAKTGYPGVELDVASGMPVEFSIPYCAPNSHYTLTSGEGTMGDLFLTVLSPLTISDASLSVFAWFENIDLTMPTGVERGILPDDYFRITDGVKIDRAGEQLTSSAWNDLVFNVSVDPASRTSVVLTDSLLLVTTAGNFVLLPAGIKIGGALDNDEKVLVTTQSAPVGISGFIVTDFIYYNATSSYFSVAIPDASASKCFSWDPDRSYESDNVLYIYAINNNLVTVTSTALIIPNVYSGLINVENITTGYLVSFNSGTKSIYIFPPYGKVKYVADAKVEINNGASFGQIYKFTSSATTNFNYATAINSTFAFILAQSNEDEEDEWYRNYPRAQATESEVIAMTGVVTNAYKTLSSMSQLPMLSSLSTPLGWIKRLGSLASTGFSKPTDVQALVPFFPIPAKGYTHVTGQDASVALAAVPDNSIGVSPGVFSTSIDEMDIGYVCKKSCYLRSDPWTTTTTGKIYSIFVSPGICNVSGILFQPSLLAFVTSMFRYWHGTMRYRISVAKTGFHTGRLRISYHPGALVSSNIYDPDNAYSWILDLSISSEIDIEIPFVSPKPWLSCDLFSHTSANPFGPTTSVNSLVGSNNLQFCTGVINIEVLNNLRVAGAASNTVDIITWVSSGDIEFSVPIMSSFVPCRLGEVPSLLLSRSKRDTSPPPLPDEILADFLLNEEPEEVVNDLPEAQAFQNITPASDHMTQLDGSEFSKMFDSSNAFGASRTLCMGESIHNLRELTRRFVPYAIKLGTTTNLTVSETVFDPAWFGTLTSSLNPEVIKVFSSGGFIAGAYTNCTSPIEYISKIYRFWRGSRRYKALVGNANTGDSAIQNFANYARISDVSYVNGNVEPPVFNSPTSPPEDTFNINSVFSHYVDGTTNRMCEVSVPYYSDTPIQCISDGTNFSNADSYCIRNKVIFSSGPTATTSSKQVVYYMSAGDDFNFGYLIGAPLLRRIVTPFEFPAG